MRSCSLLALSLLVTLSACDSGTAVTLPESRPDPVLRLAVGTEWTLTRAANVRFDDSGAPTDTVAQQGGASVTLAVTRDTLVGDETWYRIEPPRGFSHCVFGDAAWFANRADGLYRWTESPTDAELVYGVAEGEPFLDTEAVTGVLTDDDAALDLATGAVTARRYDRTWRRLELNDQIRGPIAPDARSTDFLSAERGPLALEISYVRQVEDGQFQPSGTVRYEMTDGDAGATADAVRVAPADGVPLR